jgi:hypothetical protein
MNSFEIAILRIIIKRQKPISISYITEGFPNGSEDFVLEAINNLLHLGYISYPYNETRHITYNKEKRRQILGIVDPLAESRFAEELTDYGAETTISNSSQKNKTGNDTGYNIHARQTWIAKVALVMSILVFGIVSILSSAISTGDIYQAVRLVGAHYYYRHHFHGNYNNPFSTSHGILVSENLTGNYVDPYDSTYLKRGGYTQVGVLPIMNSTLRNCDHL